MKIYTKPQLIAELKKIAAKGWIENRRHGNQGGIGNTLEDLLGIAKKIYQTNCCHETLMLAEEKIKYLQQREIKQGTLNL